MNVTAKRVNRGFTLFELALAITGGLAVAAISLTLVNQQLSFMKIFGAQTFLTEEAPLINMHVGRMVGKAERFRLHASVADALSGSNPTTSGAPVLVMNFRLPDGSIRASILSFEDRGSGKALYYYLVPVSGSLGTPQWFVTKQARNITFAVENGILRMTLTGPNGEVITYSGTMGQ
ncbi:MAG: hypothetical protein J0M04_21705 [Verrucomicrobia bacterium]|nr:hypothetical protein [Verrucomicrobiota bacterium]